MSEEDLNDPVFRALIISAMMFSFVPFVIFLLMWLILGFDETLARFDRFVYRFLHALFR